MTFGERKETEKQETGRKETGNDGCEERLRLTEKNRLERSSSCPVTNRLAVFELCIICDIGLFQRVSLSVSEIRTA